MTETDTRTFGPYEIVRRLGVGGMAETFLALRRGVHGVEQRVCLKRVLPAFASDPSFLRQFEREAHIASTLRYTGIVAVVEFGDVDGAKYLALELVDGVDLRDFLLSRPGHVLEPAAVARVALDLAYALRYAHDPSRAVVHRDLSPANVMLSRTGEVKLTDFGVARVMSSAAPTTSTGVRGKIAYMSPEHLRGEELDGRADLFALGVLLYECLCGRRPFHGAHDVEIMRRIAAGERAPVAERAPADTPPPLLRAIEELLTVDRDARTPSATALIEQLSPLTGLHQARRRLAAQVDALRGGVETREHVAQQREEPSDTSLTPVPADALRDVGTVASRSATVRAADGQERTPSRPTAPTETAALGVTPASPSHRAHGEGSASARSRRGRSGAAALLLGVVAAGVAAAWVAMPGALPSFGRAASSELSGAASAGDAGLRGAARTQAPTAHEGQGAQSPLGQGAIEASRARPAAADVARSSSPLPSAPAPSSPRASSPSGLVASALGATSPVPAPVDGRTRPAATTHDGPTSAAHPGPNAHPNAAQGSAHSALAQVEAAAAERGTTSSTSPSAPPVHAVAQAVASPREERPAADPADGADGADEQDARPGTLRVTVIPWGDVWVDGRYMGRAPTEVTLRPGRHVVAAGTDRPSARRSVMIAPGQARRVELELSP